MLECEEWRYDKFPEFYNGSNVLDFYDPEITAKLNLLEKEEEELLKIENLQDEIMEEPENGITLQDLKASLKEVRGKKAIYKLNHKLNGKLKAHKKSHNLSEMTEDLINKGFDVNKESLRSRSKVRKTISDVEAGKDKLAKNALADSDDDQDVVIDEKLAAKESKLRGRDKKRTRNADSDIDMSDDTSAVKKTGRSLTPAQRHISAQ